MPTTNPDDLPDSQLVALVRQGRGAAFGPIMRRNNRRLFRLVRAIVGDDFADQERADLLAYLKAATKQ